MNDKSEELLQQAFKLIQAEQYENAIEILQQVVKESPHNITAWYNLGYTLATVGREDEALKAYDEALAIDNEIFEIWFNKGTLLYDMADFKGAIECYDRAAEIYPDNPEVWNNLGNCYSRLGEGRKAIEAYVKAVALKPDYAQAFYNLANAHFIEENDERAIAYAEMALELNPQLRPMVDQWIHVARSRLASKKQDEEYRRDKGSVPFDINFEDN